MSLRPFLVVVSATILALALFAAWWGAASAQQKVTISGSVVNGTAGSVLPRGLPVTLHASNGAGSPVLKAQAVTDSEGRFQFDDMALVADWNYALSVDYSGVSYRAPLDSNSPLEQVELRVYETTRDVSVVAVKRQVLVVTDVDVKGREIAAVEFIHLSNESDRTLLPDLSSTRQGQFSFLRFSLPLQAAELDVRSDLPGGEIISVGTGFAITSPVVPGAHNITFSFRFPYQRDAVSYRQRFLQGAELYQVLVPARYSQMRIAPLQSVPVAHIDGSVYRVWERRNLAPGEGLTLELMHLPQPGLLARLAKSVTGRTFWQISIPSIVGATLALLLLYSAFKPISRDQHLE